MDVRFYLPLLLMLDFLPFKLLEPASLIDIHVSKLVFPAVKCHLRVVRFQAEGHDSTGFSYRIEYKKISEMHQDLCWVAMFVAKQIVFASNLFL